MDLAKLLELLQKPPFDWISAVAVAVLLFFGAVKLVFELVTLWRQNFDKHHEEISKLRLEQLKLRFEIAQIKRSFAEGLPEELQNLSIPGESEETETTDVELSQTSMFARILDFLSPLELRLAFWRNLGTLIVNVCFALVFSGLAICLLVFGIMDYVQSETHELTNNHYLAVAGVVFMTFAFISTYGQIIETLKKLVKPPDEES